MTTSDLPRGEVASSSDRQDLATEQDSSLHLGTFDQSGSSSFSREENDRLIAAGWINDLHIDFNSDLGPFNGHKIWFGTEAPGSNGLAAFNGNMPGFGAESTDFNGLGPFNGHKIWFGTESPDSNGLSTYFPGKTHLEAGPGAGEPGDLSDKATSGSDASKGTDSQAWSKERIQQYAQDMAGKLAAAADNPELMQSIFREAMSTFSSQNANSSVQDFARAMQSVLQAGQAEHGLAINYSGSEGMRDGTLDVSLLQKQPDGKPKLIDQQSHSFMNPLSASEIDSLAAKLTEGTVYQADVSKDAVRDVVSTANDIVMQHIQGQSPKESFESAAAQFSAKYPDLDPIVFARMLNGAIKQSPFASNLRAGFADIDSNTTSVSLFSIGTHNKMDIISQVPMRYRK